ncbi:hypothetical protein [Streptomyces nanshensis]|uniref:Uncharacterized protein n=1 Tax=Streptomyces nanshensis TaxID=518642 RepID=A0A1E7KYL8_9ACTN|nr:hypothetical protein [Streptomyces nanshensis]OEV08913.1 hypothetical protein AN218_24505 [Streptomyces nanshensis]
MLDVSDAVRAEIGDDEANRLLAGDNAPGAYDCSSCRAPGDTGQVRTSTVLFVGDETAVLAFAHATCIPSQIVKVSEEEVQNAVRTITAGAAPAQAHAQAQAPATAAAPAPAAAHGTVPAPAHAAAQHQQTVPAPSVPSAPIATGAPVAPAHTAPVAPEPPMSPAQTAVPAAERAVLGVTCGQISIGETLHAAVVVEPTARIARPGSDGQGDDFLPLLIEQGFQPVSGLSRPPTPVPGWSVLVAMGQLHAILQPPAGGSLQQNIWWQAHQALLVTDGWRAAANQSNSVLVYAAPVGSIGQQPREDLLREALVQAAAQGVLVAAAMPLAGS